MGVKLFVSLGAFLAAAASLSAQEPPIRIRTPETFEPPPARVAPPLPAAPAGPVMVRVGVPESSPLGRPLAYDIFVTNTAGVTLTGVRIDDTLPAGAQYAGGKPAAQVDGQALSWDLGTLRPGAAARIRVEAKPGRAGEFAPRPSVTFHAAAGAASVKITQPRLTIAATGPEQAHVGDEVAFRIKLANAGDGPAEGVRLRAELSPGLNHPQGRLIEADIPQLAPGESKDVTLKIRAGAPGPQRLAVSAAATHAETARAAVALTAVQPKLELSQAGPDKCMVFGTPTFVLTVANPGSTPTESVRLTSTLPAGLKFVAADTGGRYDAGSRSVVWELPPVAAGQTVKVGFKAKAVKVGPASVKSSGVSGNRLKADAVTPLRVRGVPAVRFEVVDLQDGLAVGAETTYEIRVLNQGTTACTDLRLVATLTEGLEVVEVKGPVGHRVGKGEVTFDALPRLATKADLVFRVKVRGAAAGDQRFRVRLSCAELSPPVIKEESTRFYEP